MSLLKICGIWFRMSLISALSGVLDALRAHDLDRAGADLIRRRDARAGDHHFLNLVARLCSRRLSALR